LHFTFLGFLSNLWPILKAIEGNTTLLYSPEILNSLFSVYSRTITSAGSVVISDVPRITASIVTAFEATRQASSLGCARYVIIILNRCQVPGNKCYTYTTV